MSKKLAAATLSLWINILLLLSKIIVAIMTNSIGLYAECAHSLFDLISSGLAYLGIKKASEPEDHSHHFGHDKFENLSSLVQTLLITVTAGIVIFEAYQKLSDPTPLEFSELGIALMVLTIPITFFISKHLHKIAKDEDSSALEADSAHFTTDSIGSIAVLVGLIFVKFGFPLADPIAAFIVGLVMLYISVELGIKSATVFMDFSPDKKTMAQIETAIKEDSRILSYSKLRARIAGSKIFVDVRLHFSADTTVAFSHKVSHEIEKNIIKVVPNVKEVNVHVESI